MTDRERIINSFRDDVRVYTMWNGYVDHIEVQPRLYKEVCNLLEDTKPVAPKREVNQFGQVLSCGCCGSWLIVTFQKYCHECGKEMKWE